MNRLGYSAVLVAATAAIAATALARLQPDPRYPFRSANFDTLIRDSESETTAARRVGFENWLEAGYAKNPKAHLNGIKTLPAALEERETAYKRLTTTAERVRFERDTGAWLHRMVKAVIPKFSLDRGFEFTNTVALGERQCLLQGVLIASLLQRMGLDAGTVMIWRNLEGATSNLGHVATLLKLSDGDAVIVDASEPMPFPKHQGVFTYSMKLGHYAFLQPTFNAEADITGFNDGTKVSQITALPYNYVRSQFYFYRGERTPGAFVNKPLTKPGMARGIAFLKRAVALEPENPLAQYVLGHIERADGDIAAANAQYKLSHALYQKFGYVPSGVQTAFDSIKP